MLFSLLVCSGLCLEVPQRIRYTETQPSFGYDGNSNHRKHNMNILSDKEMQMTNQVSKAVNCVAILFINMMTAIILLMNIFIT